LAIARFVALATYFVQPFKQRQQSLKVLQPSNVLFGDQRSFRGHEA
jgi:hypothetical protein